MFGWYGIVFDDVCWVVYGGGVGWYFFGDYCVGVDFGFVFDCKVIQYFGFGIDDDVVFQCWMVFGFFGQ